jgi:hypothetical protein
MVVQRDVGILAVMNVSVMHYARHIMTAALTTSRCA